MHRHKLKVTKIPAVSLFQKSNRSKQTLWLCLSSGGRRTDSMFDGNSVKKN